MAEFKDLAQMRRSHRKFTEQELDSEEVKLILRAALMSPTSKGQRAWQFVVVDNNQDLEKIAYQSFVDTHALIFQQRKHLFVHHQF